MELTRKARKVLTDHSWNEDRKEDITPFLKALEKYGYASFEKANDFFELFGGLSGKFSYIDKTGERSRNDFNFTVKEVKLGAQYGRKPSDAQFQWVPLGITDGAHLNIWINEKGHIVAKYEDFEELYNSATDFFNDLFANAL